MIRSRPLLVSLSVLGAAMALAVAPRAAGADITPGARRVVERFVEASGGRAVIEGQRAFYVRGTLVAFGMNGTMEAWRQQPDRSATRIEIGPLRVAEGFDGLRGWRTDPSGQLLELEGRDLDEARADAWFENDGWIAEGQGGGSVAEAGAEHDSAGTYTVLEVTPPAAPGAERPRSRRLWFDDRTGLLVRTVTRKDQRTMTQVNSDFREVAGRRLAFQSLTLVEGMPANDVRMTLDSVAVNPDIPASRFAAPAAAAGGARYLGTPGRARLPFEYALHHVWLKVSVNGGPPADFLYDTGASISVLDSAYAARIGVATVGHQQGVGAGATGSASFATVARMRVAAPDSDGVEFDDVKVAVIALDPFLAPHFWRPVAGVVGFDFIQRFVNEIDYDRRVLTLHDPASFRYAGGGTAIPLSLAGTVPVVKMSLEGVGDGLFRLDVGSGSTVDLHTPFVQRHRLLEAPGPSREVVGGGFGGNFKSVVRRMDRLALGPFAWEKPLVALSQATSGAFTSEDYAGNIGNQVLERFKCTLDYQHRMLYLEPGARYREPDVFPRSGLQLARFGGQVRAIAVLPGSPAERAGLREDDQVLSIDGRAVLEWTAEEVAERLERGPVGSRHTLELVRDGKRRRADLVLKELL